MSVSATMLESFRYWDENRERASLAELYRTIMRETETNEHMLRGRGFHAVLEEPERWRSPDNPLLLVYESARDNPRPGDPESVLVFAAVEILDLRRALGIDVYEVPHEFELGGLRIRIRADGLTGNRVDEIKAPAKCSQVQIAGYLRSYQWRLYVYAYGAERCRYHVGHLKLRKGIWRVVGYDRYDFTTYADIRSDLERLCHDFLTFCERQELLDYIMDEEGSSATKAR